MFTRIYCIFIFGNGLLFIIFVVVFGDLYFIWYIPGWHKVYKSVSQCCVRAVVGEHAAVLWVNMVF